MTQSLPQVADVTDIAPELSTEDSSRVTRFINRAALLVSADAFDAAYPLAVAYLTAHMMTLANRRGQAPVRSESVGDISVEYAITNVTKENLMLTTPYGILYSELSDGAVGVGLVLNDTPVPTDPFTGLVST